MHQYRNKYLVIPKKFIIKLKVILISIVELIPFIWPLISSDNDDLVVVTGADSTHYKSIIQFLTSLYLHEPDIKTIVFDLGFTQSEKINLKDKFKSIEIRLFDYSKYPDYFNIKKNAGEYAWKPVIIQQVLNECKSCVCWMDAGNKVIKPLVWIRKITRAVGIYSPQSSGSISDWTHYETLKYLKASTNILNKRNLNGACVSVCYQNKIARNIINQWKDLSLIKECIAPAGSNRENHRQDQAVLSVIAHQSGITSKMPSSFYGFKIQQDID